MEECGFTSARNMLFKERLLSNSTPRFLTDDEELTEHPSSVRPCSRSLDAEVLVL